MKVSVNALNRYVDLDLPVAELSETLTFLGFEVEGVESFGFAAEGVVTGEVLECRRHPDAERLSLCRVTDGSETLDVVCGAPNVAAGQKVLWAKVGASLPGGAIKKAKIRGAESHGMLCAEDELGLGSGHEGILVLPPETPAGLPLSRVAGLCDQVLELNVTPNRPDALCHLGIARELAGKRGKPLRYPDQAGYPREAGAGPLLSSGAEAGSAPRVVLEVEDGAGCSKYVGRVLRGISVGKSPAWLVRFLERLGQKSINNVVDITNFVLLVWGQPSHAFDLDRLARPGAKPETAGTEAADGKTGTGGEAVEVRVRRAREGETLVTLDGVERKLKAGDLVIADAIRPACLAGVMGGAETGIGPDTRDLFLEVACFDPGTVRRQAKAHGLSTDSSYRFERGVDPLSQDRISDYLVALLLEAAGGRAEPERLVYEAPSHPREKKTLALRPDRARKLLGLEMGAEKMAALLAGIGIEAVKKGAGAGEEWTFSIPGFRVDLTREVDLLEEVARLADYNSIPVEMPRLPLSPNPLPPLEKWGRDLRHFLRDQGLHEALSLHFMSKKNLERLSLPEGDERRAAVRLLNPLSEEWECLPTTLLPGLLSALSRNQKNQERTVRLFELSRAYFDRPEERKGRRSGVQEVEKLALLLAGDWGPASHAGQKEADFPVLKGLIENLAKRFRLDLETVYGSKDAFLHPSESADLFLGGRKLGSYGALHPAAALAFDVKGPVLVAELSVEVLVDAPLRAAQFKPYGAFFAVTRDLNVVMGEEVPYGHVLGRLPRAELPLLESVRLNSIYRGAGLAERQKALHFTFTYRHPEKSLTDEEVNGMHEKLRGALSADPLLQLK